MENMKKVVGRSRLWMDKPSPYCPGCGHGIVHRVVCELLEEMGLDDNCVFMAPVGCSILAYTFLSLDVCQPAHGRTPAAATGVKRARPDTFVVSYQGDGDLAAIGTAEIIHAANRGENITTVFVNNAIYGMTGGQMAPTTLIGQKATTCVDGRTAKQAYGGQADWNPIYEAKRNLHIPVIGNGDLQSLEQGHSQRGNLDGFMIGRAALGNPWVFWPQAKRDMVTLRDKVEIMLSHLHLILAETDEPKALMLFRKADFG